MPEEVHAPDCECSSCGIAVKAVQCRKCGTTVKLRNRYEGDPDWYLCPKCKRGGGHGLRD